MSKIALRSLCCAFLWLTVFPVHGQEQPVFAYSANSMDNSVTLYRVDKDGRLHYSQHLGSSQFPSSLALHPSGRYMALSGQTRNDIDLYRLDPATGYMHRHGEAVRDKSKSIFDLDFTPDGRFLYIAGRISNDVSAYVFNEQSGQLQAVPGSPFKADSRVRQILIHPSGKFLFAINVFTDVVSVFAINEQTGVLKQVKGSPFFVGEVPLKIKLILFEVPETAKAAPYNLAISPDGAHLYVANWISGSISAFKVDLGTGALSLLPGSPFVAEAHPYSLLVSSDGRHLYSAHWESNQLLSFERKPDGSLRRIDSEKVDVSGTATVDMWMDPSGQNLYVLNFVSNNIVLFNRELDSGRLSYKDSYLTRFHPRRFGFALSSKALVGGSQALFSVSKNVKKLQVYPIESGVPQIKQRTEVLLKSEPVSVGFDRFNQRVYVATQKPNRLEMFAYDSVKNSLQSVAARELEYAPQKVLSDLNGTFVYLSNSEHNSMSVYEFEKQNRVLKPWLGSPFATDLGPVGMRLGPAQKMLYTINEKENTVSAFMFGEGVHPTPLIRNLKQSRKVFKTGKLPKDIAFEPGGKFAYVVNREDNSVSPYWVHQNNGELTQTRFPGYKTGKSPVAVEVHPGGRFLYVLNNGDASVWVYHLNSANGLIEKKSSFQTRKRPVKIRLDEAGKFLYVSFQDSSFVSVYSLEQTGGVLKKIKDLRLAGIVDDFILQQKLPVLQ